MAEVMLRRDGAGDARHFGSNDVDWRSGWEGKFLQRPYAAHLLHHAGETFSYVDPLEGVVDHDRTGRFVAGGGRANAPDLFRVHLLCTAIERLEGELDPLRRRGRRLVLVGFLRHHSPTHKTEA